MLKNKEFYISKLLKIYSNEWAKYDKDILIEQCYDLGYTTKKDILVLKKKTKEELVRMIVEMDKENLLNPKDRKPYTLDELKAEYESFLIVHY
jgi:hypothetical protein